MKRILIAVCSAAFGVFVITLGIALAQDGRSGGLPPQTDLFNDAVLLARALPFMIALGIGFGVWQGKASMRQPKSAPNSPYVIRHDFGTVIAHWTNGIGLVTAQA